MGCNRRLNNLIEFESNMKCNFDTGWNLCKNEKPCKKHKDLKCVICGSPANHNCGQGNHYFPCEKPICKNHHLCPYHQKEWDDWKRRGF